MSSASLKTRKRILQATIHLLEASDGRVVRMTDIAKKASITRQALYLHFKTRAELLIQTTYYLDEIYGSEARLMQSRAAKTGAKRLDAYVEAWGNYIPEIYGVAKALIAMSDTDEAAVKAWKKRMQDMHEGCAAAINMLDHERRLSPNFTPEQATDFLWCLLSVQNWEHLTIECGWSQSQYIEKYKTLAQAAFIN
ncbi:MAG: TetR family transcriptional regulator [Robiginitomaculum sp.]|nr:MAG: TetR family transcriptional regulator [Robiginitomaculum sp.]